MSVLCVFSTTACEQSAEEIIRTKHDNKTQFFAPEYIKSVIEPM